MGQEATFDYIPSFDLGLKFGTQHLIVIAVWQIFWQLKGKSLGEFLPWLLVGLVKCHQVFNMPENDPIFREFKSILGLFGRFFLSFLLILFLSGLLWNTGFISLDAVDLNL